MMRLVVACAALVTAFAVTGLVETHHDADRDARTIAAVWRDVGQKLVTIQTAGVVESYGLECFRYGVDATRVDRRTLCFTPGGRLVTVAHETRNRSTVSTVLPDAARSPVSLSPGAIISACARASEVAVIRTAASNSIDSLRACLVADATIKSQVVAAAQRRDVPRRVIARAARAASSACRRTNGVLQAYAATVSRFPTLAQSIRALAEQSNQLAAAAELVEVSARRRARPPLSLRLRLAFLNREPAVADRAQRSAQALRMLSASLIRSATG